MFVPSSSFRRLLCAGVGALALAAPAALAQTPVTTQFTYQGELSNGAALVNQNCDFEFRLFDAAVGGAQQGATVTLLNQPVANGRFTVPLDFGAEYFGEARWVEVRVRYAGVGGYTALSPRQALTGAPYALGLRLPYEGAWSDAGELFQITNDGLGGAAAFTLSDPLNINPAVNAVTLGSGPAGRFSNDAGATALEAYAAFSGTAIYAEAPGESDGVVGVHARITDVNGGDFTAAIYGQNLSNTDGATGVRGSNMGFGYGVHGMSNIGRGVLGEVFGDGGYGVYGRAAGRNGTGVLGIHASYSGTSPGVHGLTDSSAPRAAGVMGMANAQETGAATFGVLGVSRATQGVGVRGESAIGVEGEGAEFGVRGIASALDGTAVRGEGGAQGVHGTGIQVGLYGEVTNPSGYGVRAVGGGDPIAGAAVRAENVGGTGVSVSAERGVNAEGVQYGVRGVSTDVNGFGGVFVNTELDGVAISASGRVEVAGAISCNVLEIQGADVAEKFPVSEPVEPGMVVAIDSNNAGKLCMARGAYNRRVAGIVSGANGLNAGTVLGHLPGLEDAPPIALSGRVWVRCDASERAIEPGDLLTTSDTPGHAMTARDADRMNGAVLGKAMTGLAQGETGLVLVLVNLQ